MIPLFRNKKPPSFGHMSLNPTAYWLYYAHNNTEKRQYFELRREELSTWDEGFYDLCAELIGQLLANHHCYTYDRTNCYAVCTHLRWEGILPGRHDKR